MKKIVFLCCLFSLTILVIFLYLSADPIREFPRTHNFSKQVNYVDRKPTYENSKKTIVIIADIKTTEIFDLIAPFYLFSATQKANVYIIAEKKSPIYLFKGLFVLPHFSFKEFDDTKIKPDAIIIPNLSAMEPQNQNPVILEWIKRNHTDTNKLLSICSGASTAAATGIYDNQRLTTHASDYDAIKKHYPKPLWVTNVSVTNSNNLYSTGGVSNAVEGSLVLIEKMFGAATMDSLKNNISYPHLSPKIAHESIKIAFNDKLTILKKVLFGENRRVGVLLQEGMDEFKLASILDTYNRTFPKSINSFSLNNMGVKSKYNLTIIPTQSVEEMSVDEIHIINSLSNLNSGINEFEEMDIITYQEHNIYMIDRCLDRIEKQHGTKFKAITKLLLDYN